MIGIASQGRVVISVLLVAVLAIALPAPRHAVAQRLEFDTCAYKGPAERDGHGVILRFLTPEQAKRLIAKTQARVRSTINLSYLGNQRVVLGLPNGRRLVALMPETMIAKPGDDVAFAGGHQTPGDACSYIPNLVTRILPPPGGEQR